MQVSATAANPHPPPIGPAAQSSTPTTAPVPPPPATASAPEDEVRLSPQAQALLNNNAQAGGGRTLPKVSLGTRPIALPSRPEADVIASLERESNASVMRDYMAKNLEYVKKVMDYVKDKLHLSKDAGLGLSDDILAAVGKKLGLAEPEKPEAIKAWQAKSAAANPDQGPPADSAVHNTSMITAYLPEAQGGGKIEIFLDKHAYGQLTGLANNGDQPSLLDLLKEDKQSKSASQKVNNGAFGALIKENAAPHPEWAMPQARLALIGTGQNGQSQPIMMMQSSTQGDYLTSNANQLLKGTLSLFKGGW